VTWLNYDSALEQLRAGGLQLEDGLEVDTPLPRRVRVDGEDREKRGWYWLKTFTIAEGPRQGSYITGAWGVYHGNDPGKQKLEIAFDGRPVTLTPEERAAMAAQHKATQARLKALRAAEAERAARAASRAWRAYVAEGESDYLKRKRVGAFGVRFSPSGNGTLAIPMMDVRGEIRGLQIIRGRARGKGELEKQYWPRGLAKQGTFHLVGGIPRGVVLLAEGYATAATLHQATGLPVAVAFDAGNLRPVAETLAKAYRKCRLLVCADDDYRTPGNPGVSSAQLAAFAVDGAFLTPIFADPRPEDRKGPTDFNDLAALEGEAVVRAQVEAKLRELGWEPGASARRLSPEGGGGDGLPPLIPVDEAVGRYALVYGGGGTLFDFVEHALVPKSDVLDLLPDHGWREWKLRPDRQVARLAEVGFDPAGTDPNIRCNLWGGWPTEPREGDCGALLNLLEYLCSGEARPREVYQWVVKWLAYPIQHPGAKMRTALVFHGPQGVGKNLLFETVMSIYGPYGRIVDQASVEDRFNDWASRKLFLVADEVVARQELYHVKNKLKGLITGDWIRINPKNVAAHDERNHVNLVFLSNETQPLVLDADDRRYVVVWTPEKLEEGFYQAVKRELAAGGREALHHHLLTLDLGDFDEHTKPPMTNAKRRLIEQGLDSVQLFLRDWQAGDVVYRRDGGQALPFCPCGSAQLYAAYLEYCRRNGEARPRPENQFSSRIVLEEGWTRGHRDRRENFSTSAVIRHRFVIPSEKALTAAAAAGREDFRRRPEETQTEWLTRCFFAMHGAMEIP
jgi:putative DNA primase/helicase